ncbi:MAG: PqqD family protein [Planctomycetes bacterium]|nr:PqqD family protein [Planctomycetota bacterium]
MEDIYYMRSETTASRLVLGEMVIVSLPDGEMTVLNESASAVWAFLNGDKTLVEVEQALQSRYDLQIQPSLSSLIASFLESNLVLAGSSPFKSDRLCPDAPAATSYEEPMIMAKELLETLAGGCPSAFDGQPWTGDCRSDYMTCDVITGAG